jgi:hypothetical protein
MENLISAFIGAQVGQLQLAAAAQLTRTDPNDPINPDIGTSVTKLIDAAQQSIEPLADAAAALATNLDISC